MGCYARSDYAERLINLFLAFLLVLLHFLIIFNLGSVPVQH